MYYLTPRFILVPLNENGMFILSISGNILLFVCDIGLLETGSSLWKLKVLMAGINFYPKISSIMQE
jgi:hypothetical protein